MSFYYYETYTKRQPEKVSDSSVPTRIKTLLKEEGMREKTKLFLESLQYYYERHSGLTKKQFESFERIEKALFEKNSDEHKNWEKDYNDEKRRVAKICASYYKENPPYFSNLVEKVLNDDTFIPTKAQYDSMCGNRYSERVILATDSKPLFPVGSVVQGRASAPRNLKNKLFSVIVTDHRPVYKAVKGGKVYLLLPFGSDTTVECEERYLKKVRKKT